MKTEILNLRKTLALLSLATLVSLNGCKNENPKEIATEEIEEVKEEYQLIDLSVLVTYNQNGNLEYQFVKDEYQDTTYFDNYDCDVKFLYKITTGEKIAYENYHYDTIYSYSTIASIYYANHYWIPDANVDLAIFGAEYLPLSSEELSKKYNKADLKFLEDKLNSTFMLYENTNNYYDVTKLILVETENGYLFVDRNNCEIVKNITDINDAMTITEDFYYYGITNPEVGLKCNANMSYVQRMIDYRNGKELNQIYYDKLTSIYPDNLEALDNIVDVYNDVSSYFDSDYVTVDEILNVEQTKTQEKQLILKK